MESTTKASSRPQTFSSEALREYIDKINFAVELIKEEAEINNLELNAFKLGGELATEYFSNPHNPSELRFKNYFCIENFISPNDLTEEQLIKLAYINEELNCEYRQSTDCIFSLKPRIKEGDKYVKLTAQEYNTFENIVLLNKQGITIINICDTEKAVSLSSVDYCISLIENNYKAWAGKVHFYFVSSSPETLKVKPIENIFPDLHSEYVIDEYLNDAFKIYDISLPKIFIIDQNNIIQYAGGNAEEEQDDDLEAIINDILQGRKIAYTKQKFGNKQLLSTKLNSFNNQTKADTESKNRSDSNNENIVENHNWQCAEKLAKFESLFKEAFINHLCKDYNKNAFMEIGYFFNFNINTKTVSEMQILDFKFSINLHKQDYNKVNEILQACFSKEELKDFYIKINLIETLEFKIP